VADQTEIPNEAWIAAVAAVGWDESNEWWPVIRAAIAAAAPFLTAPLDAENARLRKQVADRMTETPRLIAARLSIVADEMKHRADQRAANDTDDSEPCEGHDEGNCHTEAAVATWLRARTVLTNCIAELLYPQPATSLRDTEEGQQQ
jgi:hypothetical protein